MHKKKKSQKKKPHPIASLSSEEETLLSSLLEDLQNIDLSNLKEKIPSPQLAQALVEKLSAENPETPEILLAVKEAFDQKNVQKAVRKAAFKLRQKGVSLPVLDTKEPPAFKIQKVEKEEPAAYLGSIDGVGSRAIFIVVPQIPARVDLGMGVVNDEQGILEFSYNRYSKKQVKEVKAIFFERVRPMVETSLPHAATVLERAYNQRGTEAKDASRGYLQLRPWLLEQVTLLDQSPAYDLISSDNRSGQILTDSQIEKLLDHELMDTWFVDLEALKPFVTEIVKVQESPILVSDAQKAQRINELKEDAIAKIFPHEKRLLLKTRLEEMAYIFFKLEEESYARLCLAAAMTSTEEDSLLKVNPFLKFMVERTLNYLLKENQGNGGTEASGQPSSRIIMP